MKYLFLVAVFFNVTLFAQKLKLYSDETISVISKPKLYNKIIYSLENNTETDLLFYLPDDKHLNYYENIDLQELPLDYYSVLEYFGAMMEVKNDKNEFVVNNPCFVHDIIMDDYVINEEDTLQEKDKTVVFEKKLKNNLIILPKDKIIYFFKYYAFPSNDTENTHYLDCLDMDSESKYTFDIVLFQSKEFLEFILPDYYLKGLKEQNIKIFDGKIISNQGTIKWLSD